MLSEIRVSLLEYIFKSSEDSSLLDNLVFFFFSVDTLALKGAALALLNFACTYGLVLRGMMSVIIRNFLNLVAKILSELRDDSKHVI